MDVEKQPKARSKD